MDHVAIMKKGWNMIPKIVGGQKTVESRWYKTKRDPWDKIKKGDVVYFKDAGQMVCAKANVSKVIQYDNLSTKTIQNIINGYDKVIALPADAIENGAKDTNYCILIFLSDPMVVKPFQIDKRGYGSATAWISVANIKNISSS